MVINVAGRESGMAHHVRRRNFSDDISLVSLGVYSTIIGDDVDFLALSPDFCDFVRFVIL